MYDESEAEPLTQPDTSNRTKFHPDDTNHDTEKRLDGTATFEQHYKRLSSHNAGIYNGKWADKTKLYSQDNLAVWDALAGQLELSDFQKTEGRRAFATLNLRDLSSPDGIDAPLIAIMVAAIVSRRDGRRYHPKTKDANNDSLFVTILDGFDYDDSILHSAYGKVQHRLGDGQ